MIPRFDQTTADKIVKAVIFINRDMLSAYQAGATDPFVSYFCYFSNATFDMLFTMAYSTNVELSHMVCNHENNIEQIIELLDDACTNTQYTKDGCKKWNFKDYGFSIQEPPASRNASSAKIHKGLWSYKYDQTLPQFNDKRGIISGNDIERIFAKLATQPSALASKPDCIMELESLLGVQATRHKHFFGRWVLNKPSFVSIVCNPFGLDCGQSDAADNFDTYYYANDTVEGFETVTTIKELYATHNPSAISKSSWDQLTLLDDLSLPSADKSCGILSHDDLSLPSAGKSCDILLIVAWVEARKQKEALKKIFQSTAKNALNADKYQSKNI